MASANGTVARLWQPVTSVLSPLRRYVGQTSILAATVLYMMYLVNRSKDQRLEELGPEPSDREKELAENDPGLLAKYSTYKSFRTSIARYPAIRVFYKPHTQADKLPNNPPLPLLVFLHGVGGSVSQLHLLLNNLVNVGPCLAIDLPGCGLSRFAPTRWRAYSFDAHVELWAKAIEDHCDTENGQQVVLIGHSMGCTYAQALASRSKAGQYQFDVSGLVAICPGLFIYSPVEKAAITALCFIPESLFNIWREWDKKGGKDSGSVMRLTGNGADAQTRELQLKFNDQSQTPVFRRTCWGILNAAPVSAKQWAALPSSIPIQLVGGEHDPLTPVKQLHKIAAAIRADSPDRKLKTTILPGSHALPFDSNNYRSVAGIIESFLGDLDERLSLGWQLNYLATEGKWDVKNLEKWQAIDPVSEPIGKPVPLFRAMKTMREIDDVHSPKHFVEKWENHIMAVIDISHDTPVYDPKTLSDGGIEYHKFPTVSKYPPDENEVREFGLLVDKIRNELGPKAGKKQIAVHCHYGFNRTGYFIAAYLVERKGYSVQEAIDEFAEKRPPGIRHDHFLDTMFARYSSKKEAE